MYYISKLLLYGTEVNNLQIKDYANDYDLSTMEIYLTDTKTGVTNRVAYRDLKEDEFGVVDGNLYEINDDLWRFLDYVDKPEVVKRNINAIEILNFLDYKPVDENCIFWRRLRNEARLSVDVEPSVLNLLDLYMYVFRNYNNITDTTEIHLAQYSHRHRLFLNKDVIRFITKLIALRR